MNCCRRAFVTLALGVALAATAPDVMASEPVPLTRDGAQKYSPVFSDGGKTLYYTLFATPTLLRVTRLSLADGKAEPINPEATKSEFEPAVSADGRILAYIDSRAAGSAGIIIRDLQAKTRVEIPPLPGLAGYRSLAISPDSKSIVYSFSLDRWQKLFVISSQGGSAKPLTDGVGIDLWPDFSRDGRQIVFGSSRDGNFEIYIMNADGGAPRRLTDSPRQDIRPRFSPDGKRIAFTSHREGPARVFVMSADGSNVQRVETGAERDDYATWHPDGQHLVVVSELAGHQDLYLVDAPRE